MGDKRCGKSMAEGVEMQANRNNKRASQWRQTSTSEGASDLYESSAAASAPSSLSAGLSNVISISTSTHRT